MRFPIDEEPRPETGDARALRWVVAIIVLGVLLLAYVHYFGWHLRWPWTNTTETKREMQAVRQQQDVDEAKRQAARRAIELGNDSIDFIQHAAIPARAKTKACITSYNSLHHQYQQAHEQRATLSPDSAYRADVELLRSYRPGPRAGLDSTLRP